MTAKKKPGKCITPNCNRIQTCRGLCASCNTYARMKVKNNETTWQELEALRLALPLAGDRHPFVVAFEKKKKTKTPKPGTLPIRKQA